MIRRDLCPLTSLTVLMIGLIAQSPHLAAQGAASSAASMEPWRTSIRASAPFNAAFDRAATTACSSVSTATTDRAPRATAAHAR